MCETATPEQADAMPYDLYREGYYYYGRDAAKAGQHLQLHGVEPHGACGLGRPPREPELINVPLLHDDGQPADTGSHDHRLL